MQKTLVVQIPAYNEEAHIDTAIRDVPTHVAGFEDIRVVVLDDGSVDRTAAIAGGSGLTSVVRLPHGGLGATFRQGLRHALSIGADVIVNMDADLQYKGSEIPGLVAPILEGSADVVIGDRQIRQLPGYPRFKLFTQTAWSALIERHFEVEVRDATSGFRAYNRGGGGVVGRAPARPRAQGAAPHAETRAQSRHAQRVAAQDHSFLRQQGLFDARFVETLVHEHLRGERDHRRQLWSLLAFNIWHDARERKRAPA